MTTVTLVQPGAMGAEVGAQARRAGARVLYVPTGRGSAGIERARKADLEAAESLGSTLAVSHDFARAGGPGGRVDQLQDSRRSGPLAESRGPRLALGPEMEGTADKDRFDLPWRRSWPTSTHPTTWTDVQFRHFTTSHAFRPGAGNPPQEPNGVTCVKP
jgi:hypothetical protein